MSGRVPLSATEQTKLLAIMKQATAPLAIGAAKKKKASKKTAAKKPAVKKTPKKTTKKKATKKK